MSALTERQAREVDYHRTHAVRVRDEFTRIDYEVVTSDKRRWWNQSWGMWTDLRSLNLAGKHVLSVGCGAGDDCLRMSKLGAIPYGFDLSPELIELARELAARENVRAYFDVMPSESMEYPDAFFDAVLCHDILHHVDIPATMQEIRRVSKPGAKLVLNEVYTHSLADRIRNSRLVRDVIYKRMVRVVYGDKKPYITQDERKMTETDIALVTQALHSVGKRRYFDMAVNRVLPPALSKTVNQVDYLLLNATPLSKYLGGRIAFVGTL